jgi:hypothetical protein
VLEAQPEGVQRLPRQEHLVAVGSDGPVEVRQAQAVAAAVDLVGQDGAADAGEVDADRVGAAGARVAAAVGVAAEALDHLVVGAGVAARLPVGRHHHLDPVVRVAGDPPLRVVAVAVGQPGRQRPVLLEDLAQLVAPRPIRIEGRVADELVVPGLSGSLRRAPFHQRSWPGRYLSISAV